MDLFVTHQRRWYGIQRRQKTFGKLTTKIIDEEIKAADEGLIKIELTFATTAPNYVKLVMYVSQLSDSREADGKFRVSNVFWDIIEALIRRHSELQANLATRMVESILWQQGQRLAR